MSASIKKDSLIPDVAQGSDLALYLPLQLGPLFWINADNMPIQATVYLLHHMKYAEEILSTHLVNRCFDCSALVDHKCCPWRVPPSFLQEMQNSSYSGKCGILWSINIPEILIWLRNSNRSMFLSVTAWRQLEIPDRIHPGPGLLSWNTSILSFHELYRGRQDHQTFSALTTVRRSKSECETLATMVLVQYLHLFQTALFSIPWSKTIMGSLVRESSFVRHQHLYHTTDFSSNICAALLSYGPASGMPTNWKNPLGPISPGVHSIPDQESSPEITAIKYYVWASFGCSWRTNVRTVKQ